MFNKPLKTRIKKTVNTAGEEFYTAQYKYLFFWYNFGEANAVWSHTTPRSVWLISMYSYHSDDIKEVKSLIDDYLIKFKENEKKIDEKKVVSTEYIKYP